MGAVHAILLPLRTSYPTLIAVAKSYPLLADGFPLGIRSLNLGGCLR